MRARTLIAWVAAALVGLALAAGVTLAVSQLSSQRIGLSGEPASAGRELVPRAIHRRAPTPPPVRTVTAPPGRPATPSDDGGPGDD